MKEKYFVCYTNDNGELIEKKFVKLSDIADKFNVEKHNIQKLIQYCKDNNSRKFVHPKNKKLYERVKVFHINTEIIL